ncbi:MAG: glutamate--cysteine ligase, partial [Deltaproteobacteria bacterium]
VNGLLDKHHAQLLPTAMHPLMDPHKETRLWPHAHNEVYEAFNHAFDCRGHGWSNLQSTHLNLPFANDAEFGQLHAAIRLLLPILPALSASSPIVEGKLSPHLDARLEFYRHNARRVPSVAGKVIPEGAYTRKDYEMNILARIYQDMSPHDPEGVLQHEWANARGAIARFERSAIEIRTLDVQECPRADISIAAAIVSVLKALCSQRWVSLRDQQMWPVAPLAAIWRGGVTQAHDYVIDDEAYLRAFNFTAQKQCRTSELWQHLLETVWPAWREPMRIILSQGPLARRIVRAVGRDLSADHIRTVYRELGDCLRSNRMFAF